MTLNCIKVLIITKRHDMIWNIFIEHLRDFIKNETNGFMATVLEPKESKLPVYIIFNCYGGRYGGHFLKPKKHRKMIVEIAKDNGSEKYCKRFDWNKTIPVEISYKPKVLLRGRKKKQALSLFSQQEWNCVYNFILCNKETIHRHWIGETDSITLFKELTFNKSSFLCSGIFWVVSEDINLSEYKLLAFTIPCDINGNATGNHIVPLNSKSGKSYNHKKLWESDIQNNVIHKLYNKKQYNYYPRGRVEVKNKRATIYLNPFINSAIIINEIIDKFGLTKQNIGDVRIINDGSSHYECFIDMEF